ncbi:MAG: ImmA/IrrE family metallo-endopeptidase [Acidimicrobiales bacterium]|nr:ImmA/IrrE family metallo-endopeptidase [Acidimicrobiales bacterium]MCB9374004.1 ImmA/IrrE family metallo-endopeptidase [Microthrixaceae bacterium]
MGVWKVWRELRQRPHIDFALVDMPPGAPAAVYARRGDRAVVLIDRALPPAERLAALAHELVHDERGGSGHVDGMPPSLGDVVAREERRVDRIVAERLIPRDRLEQLVETRSEIEGHICPLVVAEEFGVPERVAHDALSMLLERRSA